MAWPAKHRARNTGDFLMFARRNTLVQALNDLDTGGLPNAEIIIVSCAWWESLSTAEQTAIEG